MFILEGYGMLEGVLVVIFNYIDVGWKFGSVGMLVWGVEVKLVDEEGKEVFVGEKGEFIYCGYNVMKGYYKWFDVNVEVLWGGWMYLGDVVVKDEDGFFYIVDWIKDMIFCGGFNVYLCEVEEVMMKYEVVFLVVVIGVFDDGLGEEVWVCVVLKEGVICIEEEFILWICDCIVVYKYFWFI